MAKPRPSVTVVNAPPPAGDVFGIPAETAVMEPPEETTVVAPPLEVPTPEVEPIPEPEIPTARKGTPARETMVVDKLGLYKVLIALIQEKPNFSGQGARRAFKAVFQDADDEAIEALWSDVKSHFWGGSNYDKIANE